jgi:Flp pilus assembly protein TadB
MDKDLMDQSKERRRVARRRADSVFRGMLLIFVVGFLMFAILGYIMTKELGIVVLFVCIGGLTVVVGIWGKRWIIRNIDRN